MNPVLPIHEVIRVFLLSVPLIVGGVVHMIVVKADILSYLKKPIHQRWFGQNKTWRGVLIMPLAIWPGVVLAQWLESLYDLNRPLLVLEPSWLLALVLGLGYCLAELPNSLMKRRLGIKEGETSEKLKWLFVLFDQADSAIGCILAYWLLIDIPFHTMIYTVVLGTLIHLSINMSLHYVGLRRNPY